MTRNITVRDTDGTAWLTTQAGPEFTSHALATAVAKRYRMTETATVTVDGDAFTATDLVGPAFTLAAVVSAA